MDGGRISESKNVNVTDLRAEQLLRILGSVEREVGRDTAKMTRLRIGLLGIFRHDNRVPGDSQSVSIPGLENALAQDDMEITELISLFRRVLSGYTVVHAERTRGTEHGKQAAALQEIKVTADELSVIRKHYAELSAMMSRLQSLVDPGRAESVR